MAPKKKASKKDKRPIIKLMCTICKRHVYSTRKNPKNTTERLELRKYCPDSKCRKTTVHKETK